jgi:hypothetical protein
LELKVLPDQLALKAPVEILVLLAQLGVLEVLGALVLLDPLALLGLREVEVIPSPIKQIYLAHPTLTPALGK